MQQSNPVLTIFKPLLLLLILTFLAGPSVATDSHRVNHVVLCWLNDAGNAEQRQRIIELSKRFRNIPGVLEVRAGEVMASDRKIVDDSFDVGIYLTFADRERMTAYLKHPDHVAAVKEVLRPLVKKVLVYDFLETGAFNSH